MAKNLSPKFATMSEDERRRFAQEEKEGTVDRPVDLDFEEPRDADQVGAHFASPKEEFADPEMSAQLDGKQHERTVGKSRKASGESPPT